MPPPASLERQNDCLHGIVDFAGLAVVRHCKYVIMASKNSRVLNRKTSGQLRFSPFSPRLKSRRARFLSIVYFGMSARTRTRAPSNAS